MRGQGKVLTKKALPLVFACMFVSRFCKLDDLFGCFGNEEIWEPHKPKTVSVAFFEKWCCSVGLLCKKQRMTSPEFHAPGQAMQHPVR